MAATQFLVAFANRAEHIDEDCKRTVLVKWREITAKMLVAFVNRRQKKNEKSPQFIPPDDMALFDKLEQDHDIRFSTEQQFRCYFEFCQQSSDYGLVEASKVPALLEKLEIRVSPARLKDALGHIFHVKGGFDYFVDDGGEDGLNFKSFLSLIAQILLDPDEVDHDRHSTIAWLRHLPLDPDSQGKQMWDAWCLLLLLYCSFAVPYNIAFEAGSAEPGLTTTDYVDVLINTMFMIDIGLTFITAYDKQGCLITDYRKIAENYLTSWFFLDIAGSFPFDQVISAALQANGQGSASNFSAMKLIRMLKLIRAVKFLNKLNRLKEKEGFEMLGSFIGVFSALFIVIFVSHLVGCMYIMIVSIEPAGENWLHHYSPLLIDADNWTRYVTALYWATVTITTMGYGDILPVTHTERMVSIGVALTGAIVFSHCMGLVSSLIAQARPPLLICWFRANCANELSGGRLTYLPVRPIKLFLIACGPARVPPDSGLTLLLLLSFTFPPTPPTPPCRRHRRRNATAHQDRIPHTKPRPPLAPLAC
jgi:hypothetical protein